MNLSYIEQHDIARRYLQGRLSEADNTLFEEYLLDKPELVNQLQLDAILLQNLSKSSVKTTSSVHKNGLNQTINEVWKLGLAASLGALMVLPFVEHQPGDSVMEQQITGHNQIVYLESTRSTVSQTKDIMLNNDVEQLILMIQPATLDETEFAVSLKSVEQPALQSYKVQSQLANSGDLIVTIPATLLHQGSYQLDLSGINSDFSQRFTFEFSRTSP